MKKRMTLLVICIFTLLFTVSCKTTNTEKIQDNQTPPENIIIGTSKNESDMIEEESEEASYTIETMSKEMSAKKTAILYLEPSTESTMLTSLQTSEIIKVTGKVKENGWYQVSYNNAVAYMHFDDLSEPVNNVTPPDSSNTTPPASTDSTISDTKGVKDLDIASQTNQLILVSVGQNKTTLSMYTKKTDGAWEIILSTNNCYIGRDGLGKTQEGNMQTPKGTFHFTKAFGINNNPGTQLAYTVVDDSHYWVDDPNSSYYNRFVSTKEVSKDWASAEHIVDYTTSYRYCLALDYNKECIPGEGSAIFLHCTNYRATGGCIAIPEADMITVLKNINANCIIVIDTETNIWHY